MKSRTIDGQVYDIGAFVFPRRKFFSNLFPELKPVMFKMRRPIRILNQIGKDYRDVYPFSIGGLLDNLSFTDLIQITASYLKTFKPIKANSFHEWIVSQTGTAFYESSGLRRYIERFFSLPDTEISLKFTEDRMGFIRNYRLEKILKNKIHRLLSRKTREHSISDSNYPLLRPSGGFEVMFRIIEKALHHPRCRISRNEHVLKLKRLKDGYSITTNRRAGLRFDLVILAAPPQELIKSVTADLEFENVESFNLLSLFLKARITGEAEIIYNSSIAGKWKRMTIYNRLYNEIAEEDRFTVEFVIGGNGAITHTEDAFSDFVSSSEYLGLSQSEIVLCGATITQNAYPKHTIDQEAGIISQREFLSDLGIMCIGRQGEYSQCTSSECIQTATVKLQHLLQFGE